MAAAGEKALVFSQFVAAPFGAEAIAHAVGPLRPLLLTGRMSAAVLDDAFTQFTAEPERRVLVASLRAGGVGLNLTAASHFEGSTLHSCCEPQSSGGRRLSDAQE